MKYEWKKEEKNIFLPKEMPTIVEIPKAKYFCIRGVGNPNDIDFANRVSTLYSLAYAVRMMPKNGTIPNGYFEYTVYPLEGIWSLTEEGIKQKAMKNALNKNEFIYTIMIKQPAFLTKEVIEKAFEIVRRKKQNPLLDEVCFEEFEDGKCVQMLHIGSYDDEPRTFEIMNKFIYDNNLLMREKYHKEIYLSDVNKVDKNKLKTVLRYYVNK